MLNKINWRVRVRVRMRTHSIVNERIYYMYYNVSRTVRTLFQFIELINGFISEQQAQAQAYARTQMWHIAKCNKVKHSGKYSWQNAQQKTLCIIGRTRIKLINTTYLLPCSCCCCFCFILIVSFLSVLLLLFFAPHSILDFVLFCFALHYLDFNGQK